MRHLVLALALCAAGALPGAAQQPFAPGTRVRLQTVTGPLQVGTVAALSRDTLLFRPGSSPRAQAIPADRLRRVETSLGRGPRTRLAGIGGLVGLAAGGVLAMVVSQSCDGGGVQNGSSCGAPPVGLVLGSGLLGAGIGALLPPRERWHTVMAPHVDIGPRLPRRAQGIGALGL